MEDLRDRDRSSDEPVEIDLLAAESAVVLVDPQDERLGAGLEAQLEIRVPEPARERLRRDQGALGEGRANHPGDALDRIHAVSLSEA